MGLLEVLRRRLSAGGQVLLENSDGSADRALESSAAIHVCENGGVDAAMTTCTGVSPPRACAAWLATPATRASSCSTHRSSTAIRASSEHSGSAATSTEAPDHALRRNRSTIPASKPAGSLGVRGSRRPETVRPRGRAC